MRFPDQALLLILRGAPGFQELTRKAVQRSEEAHAAFVAAGGEQVLESAAVPA